MQKINHTDAAALREAQTAMERTATALGRAMRSARTATEQRRWVIWSAVGGMVTGAVLWAAPTYAANDRDKEYDRDYQATVYEFWQVRPYW